MALTFEEIARKHVTFVRVRDAVGVQGSVRWGYYETHISDDQWWTPSELRSMLDWIEYVSGEEGRYCAWQTVRSEWDDTVEHWFLRVDVYGFGHETWKD